MSEHTKGPWAIHAENMAIVPLADAYKPFGKVECTVTGDNLPNTLCLFAGPRDGLGEDETYANAFRIVACVNALEGYNPAAVRDVVEAGKNTLHELEAMHRCLLNKSAIELIGKVIYEHRKALAALEGGAA